MAAQLRLFTYWRSSCSYRVRISLAHKGLLSAVEQVPVHLVREGVRHLSTQPLCPACQRCRRVQLSRLRACLHRASSMRRSTSR